MPRDICKECHVLNLSFKIVWNELNNMCCFGLVYLVDCLESLRDILFKLKGHYE